VESHPEKFYLKVGEVEKVEKVGKEEREDGELEGLVIVIVIVIERQKKITNHSASWRTQITNLNTCPTMS